MLIYGEHPRPPMWNVSFTLVTNNTCSSWVRAHAQDYILEYFRQLSEQRKRAHSSHLDRITAHAYYHYNAPPHPDQLSQAQNALKRGIDEDWQASVQRYPEVLQYFYGLVELTLPADDEPSVKEPPLGALTGHRKAQRRGSGGGGHGHAYGAITYPDAEQLPPRTPPPGRLERRTPAPSRERRQVPYRPATAHIDHAPFYPPY